MNKKGKNKKGKVPNPPQESKLGDKFVGVISDIETSAKTSENVEEIMECVKEERVPGIISEIIPPPIEAKDEDSPKKPKRNRGKKKKGKEDDSENNFGDESKERDKKSIIEEISDSIEVEPLDMPIAVTTIRKKKNKKKSVEQKTEEPITSDLEKVTLDVSITNIKNEPEFKQEKSLRQDSVEPEVKQEISLCQDSAEPEVKSSKKKNKKKKRNDSEIREKEEISCTAAFQKLVEPQEETLGLKVEESCADDVIQGTKSEIETSLKEEISIKETIAEKKIERQKYTSTVPGTEPQPLPVLEGKGKKKNKKDKKDSSQIVENISTPQEDITNVTSLSVDTITEQVSTDIMDIEQEISPKPKAKITKPVEKKSKVNQDSKPDESTLHNVSRLSEEQLPSIELASAETILIEKNILRKDTETICQPVGVSIIEATSIKVTELPEDFEPINIPETIGKKRKKGAKVPKTPDVSFEILDSQLEMDIKQTDFETISSNKELKILSETDVVQKHDVISSYDTSEVPLDPQLESKVTVDIIPQPDTQKHVLLTPEPSEEAVPVQMNILTIDKEDNTQIKETKSGKKRRKSPKPPQADRHKLKDLESITQVPLPNEPIEPVPEVTKDVEEQVEASNVTRIYDIEISSIKADESEGSVCDTIPDITYPRSVSQQLTDDNNNNTVITEIFPLQGIVLDTQKQENVCCAKTSVITKSKQTTSPPKEEKTDIKSKMMEVNQDMEELRLSIERSLAELTAMERNDEVTGKLCQASKLKDEENLSSVTLENNPMLPKKDSEIIGQATDTEKPAIKKPEEQSKVTKKFEKQLEPPLLLLDDNQSSNNKIMQPNFEVNKSETTECTIETTSKEIIKDELKNIPPLVVDSKIDLVTSTITEHKSSENLKTPDNIFENKPIIKQEMADALSVENKAVELEAEKKDQEINLKEQDSHPDTPVCPARKDQKNKHKKKKGKQDIQTSSQPSQSAQSTVTSQSTTTAQEVKKEEKTEMKTEKKGGSKDSKDKSKQQASSSNSLTEQDLPSDMGYEPIENFEDALTSSVDDVNKTFEIIVKETQEQCNPKINITAPDDEKSPVSPPKNLLGHPDIPVSSNKRDYKKEKDKIPNEITATVNVKDGMDVERKQSKNTQTANKLKHLKNCKLSENEEFVYKYSFRKVFLQSSCHVCKKELGGTRLPCCYCNLVFYCNNKHKDEDWPLHQAFCFAVSTIGHLKDQKHIYADTKNVTGQDYRLIRMQMIVSCEKVLKRRLVPWEQEALLYPRMCAHVPCREWRQTKLSDCQRCGQISFCTENPDHYPKTHSRWCKSYSLYQKLVSYQQTKGRLEPKLPTKVMQEYYEIPEKINEVLAAMYEEKIDMNDIQYAALTQLATAPLTAAYCYQLYRKNNFRTNGYKTSIFTIHVVGAELQFEADALNKWEVFYLHLRPDLQELRVVLINYNLNPSNLPLELLGKIKLCDLCRQDKRRVVMHFQDKRTYGDYKSSEDFIIPDLVCAFNPSIQRSSVYNGKDPWPSTINAILKQKIPFIITSYTITELQKDCIRIKECSDVEFKFISEPKLNCFASVRPDRNFITDDEMPLMFKNYCYAVICG